MSPYPNNLSMAQEVLFAISGGLIVNQTFSPTINITNEGIKNKIKDIEKWMEKIKDMELLLIGLLLSNYMLIKNQRNNLKKFIIIFLFSNIWGGLNLYSMYEYINGIEKINILCTLLLILVGDIYFIIVIKKEHWKGYLKYILI